MKNLKNIFALLVIALTGLSLTACSSDDDLDTNQYQGDVTLNVYGPSPVMRGGTLRFLGSNLDQVAQVQIPGIQPITNIEVVKSGVPSEIRVIVPHDGPQEGLVKLITKSGKEISTTTELRYTEGLDAANIVMPASAMPGETIKLTVSESGDDYLDIIHMVEFAEGVQVGEDQFISHTRYVIELVVPEEAQTGKLNLYTADLTVTEVAESNVEYQIITTEKALEVGTPTVSKTTSPRGEVEAQGQITAKAGETITLTGNCLQVVASIAMGDVDVTEFTVAADGGSLSFTLPAEAPDGDITLVCKSGIEVPVAVLNTVKPTNCKVAVNPVKANNILVVSGADIDLVTAVNFADKDGEYTITVTGEDLTNVENIMVSLLLPETACEGNLQLVMANGATVDVPFQTVKPVVAAYDANPVSAGALLKVTGSDLDLVKTVTFGEAEAEAEADVTGSSLTVTVPMAGVSGKPLFNLANGTSVEGPELSINEAVFCYVTEWPGEDVELKAGQAMILGVANGDKLTSVLIKGTECQYVLVNEQKQLIVGVPENAGPGSEVKLISSNGEISYKMDFIPNSEITTVLWTGTADLAGWSWNWQIGDGTSGADNPRMFADMDLQEGDIIRIYATAYNEWWQVQFFDGHWTGQTEIGVATGLNNGNNINSGIYNLDEHGGAIEIPVTATLKEQLTTLYDWGYCWILQGEGVVITKIAVTHIVPTEQVVWTGEAVVDDWGGQPTFFSDGAPELLEAGLKVGSTIRCYLTATQDTWNCQVWDGHWHGMFAGCDFNQDAWSLADHKGAIEFTVTEAIYTEMTTPGGWGGAFLLNGDNVICTKVTIE